MDKSPHYARELVLKALYAYEQGEKKADDVFSEIFRNEKLSVKNKVFAKTLFQLVISNLDWTDRQITLLAINWDLNRIGAIDRNILRMTLIELENIPETPFRVVLNEAIELAKRFSTVESSKFVNGILDNFVKKKKLI